MLKSALTAALSGAPAAPPAQPPAASATSAPRAGGDTGPFPCLAFADEDPSLGTISEGVEGFAVSKFVPVGSAPTANLLDGQADYPLNPRSRRAGKENIAALSSSMTNTDALGRSFSGAMPSSSLTSNFLSEAVIGSLPKGLSSEERLFIAQNTPMSPSMNLLNAMPADKVGHRSVEGQKLRRHILRGAVLVFVTAGYSGKRFIFERAKELGVRSVVIDGPDSWIQSLVPLGVIEKFIPMDFADADTVFDRCLEAVKAVKAQLGDLDGITTFCEMAVPLASRLAEKLGLPSNPPSAVDNARDKFKTRECVEKAGLPSPKHFLITSEDQLAEAGGYVGFPAVVKPVSGAASIGVIRCNSQEELEKAYRRVHSDLKKARIVAGAIVEGGDDNDSGNAGTWIDLHLMLEEYLDGTEVDCDLIFSDGHCVYGAITDNWPTVEPYFNETGSNCPSILSRQQQTELMELSVKSVQALGFKLGVFHVEGKYTSRGARLIEVNCRMGGGPVRDTNLLVWGVDLVEEHMMACAGIPTRPLIARRPLKQIAEYTINATKSGVLKNVDFLTKWQSHPDVLYARPLIQPGAKCVCVQDGLPTWICELMVSRPTVKESIELINEIEATINKELLLAIV